MPDWQKLVSRQLCGLPLDPAEKDEIHAELATHLEDAYESLLGDGINNSEAARRTLCLASDWQDLRRQITLVRRRKDTMTNRVTQLWLPGLATFLLSQGILAVLQIFGTKAWILAKEGHLPIAQSRTGGLAARGDHRHPGWVRRGRRGTPGESDPGEIYRPQHCALVSDFCSVWLGAGARSSSSCRRPTHTTVSSATLSLRWRREPLTLLGPSIDKRGAPRESKAGQS